MPGPFQFTQYLFYVSAVESNALRFTTSVDGVNWSNPKAVGGHSSPFTPATATFGVSPSYPDISPGSGILYLAYVANDGSNSLRLTSSSDGVNFGGSHSIPTGGHSSKFAPALAISDNYNQMTVVFVANDGTYNLMAVTTTNLASASGASDVKWGDVVAVSGQQSNSAPALTSMLNAQDVPELVLAYVATNGSYDLLAATSMDGVHWNASENVTGQQSVLAPSISYFVNSGEVGCLDVAYVAANGSDQLLSTLLVGSAKTWQPSNWVTGQSSLLAPAVYTNVDANGDNVLILAYVAANGSHALLTSTSTDGVNWSHSNNVTELVSREIARAIDQKSSAGPCLGAFLPGN